MAYSSLLNVERDASLLNDTPKNETIQFFVYKFDMCLYEKIMMNQAFEKLFIELAFPWWFNISVLSFDDSFLVNIPSNKGTL